MTLANLTMRHCSEGDDLRQTQGANGSHLRPRWRLSLAQRRLDPTAPVASLELEHFVALAQVSRPMRRLGPPARCPSHPFLGWEGAPSQINYRQIGYDSKKVGNLILTSLLEDLGRDGCGSKSISWGYAVFSLSSHMPGAISSTVL